MFILSILKFIGALVVNTLRPVLGFIRAALYPVRHPIKFLTLVVLVLVVAAGTWIAPRFEQIQTTVSEVRELAP